MIFIESNVSHTQMRSPIGSSDYCKFWEKPSVKEIARVAATNYAKEVTSN